MLPPMDEEKLQTLKQALFLIFTQTIDLLLPNLRKDAGGSEMNPRPSEPERDPVFPVNPAISVSNDGTYTTILNLGVLMNQARSIRICPRDPEKDSMPELTVDLRSADGYDGPMVLHGAQALDAIRMLRMSGVPIDENGKQLESETRNPEFEDWMKSQMKEPPE